MKRYLLLMPLILATTAAIADTQATVSSSRGDAQAQAAALLSRPHTSVAVKAEEGRSALPSMRTDAQAQAAALLSGVLPGRQVSAAPQVVKSSGLRQSGDAQAQAAALLSGSRTSTHSQGHAEAVHGGARTIGKAF